MNRLRTVLIVALAGLLASTSVVFVDETEYAYITRFGRLIDGGIITEPGLVFKLPWPIERVRRLKDGFDRRLQIHEPRIMERITRDKKALTVGSYVCWKIADGPEAIGKYFRTVGTTAVANQRLEELLSAMLSAAIGKKDLVQLVALADSAKSTAPQIDAMMTELTGALKQQAAAFGIEVVDVRIKRFNYPSEVRPAIYDRIRSERNRFAVQYRSEGDSEAQKIRSEADLERDKLLAEAESQAVMIKGKAEADKTRILNEAQAKDPQFYNLLRTLEAYGKILDEKTTLVLSTDNPIFQLLTQKSLLTNEPARPAAGTPAAGAARPAGEGSKPANGATAGPGGP
jgi:membrane protease subunit HflC